MSKRSPAVGFSLLSLLVILMLAVSMMSVQAQDAAPPSYRDTGNF